MSDLYDENKIRMQLKVHPQPLRGIDDSPGEWQLGGLSFAKRYPHFRSGWGRPLNAGAYLHKQWFDLDGRSGWAVIFHSGGDPADYFAGWVPAEREADADQWIAFLNSEIAARLAAAQRPEP